MQHDDGDPRARARPGRSGDHGEADVPVDESDAALVVAARAGDERAFGRLFDRWFDSVHDIAWRILRDRDLAAEVAQDVFLAAWQGLGDLEQPGSFGGWVRRIARNRALNRLDRERRSRPDSEAAAAAIDRDAPDLDMTAALGEREQRELVWAAAAALGERDASLLDLHLRHGMGAPELAAELGVTPNNAHQLLYRLKGKLGGAIRAWVLWRGGGASCPGLDRAVADAGVTSFGAAAVRAVDRHAKGCARCEEHRTLRLAPEALFAAVPIGVVPPVIKAEAAAALAEAGVPMSGSTAAASGGPVADASAADGSASGDAGSAADGTGDSVGTDGIASGGDPARPDGVAADGDAVSDPALDASGEAAPSGTEAPTEAPTEAVGGPPPDGDRVSSAVTPVDGTSAAAIDGANAVPPLTVAPVDSPDDGWRPRSGRRRRVLVLVGLAALVLLAGAGVLASDDGGREQVATSDPTTSTTARATSSTTTTAPATTEAAVAAPVDPAPADPAPSTEDTAGTTATTPVPAVPPVPDPEPDPTPDPPPEPPAPASPPPTIGGFRVTRPGTACTVTMTWQSTDADSASITGLGGGLPPSGTRTSAACVSPGTALTLTVTGAGGSASQTATAP